MLKEITIDTIFLLKDHTPEFFWISSLSLSEI